MVLGPGRSADDLCVERLAKGTYYGRVGNELLTAFRPDGPVELCQAAKSAPLVVK